MIRKATVVLALLLAVPACTDAWSEQEFRDLVEYCEDTLPTTPQQPNQQCDATMLLLQDDLGCPVETVYEFIDETSELNYGAARTILEEECESPDGVTSVVPQSDP